MKISYSWLKDYLNISESPEKTGERLTDTGLEVEGIEEVQSVPGGLEGIVIGEVLTCEKHANADKLQVTTVNIGEGEPLNIVCGAPNVAAGQKVVVATVGSKLYPVQGEPFEIKKGKIRGEVSMGMICAEDEIGLGTSHDGIMVLPNDATVGAPAASFFNLESDFVFEIGLTPNRADATSHTGVARDLVAVAAIDPSLEVGEIQWPSLDNFRIDSNDSPIEVSIENTEACPRYTSVSISGVKVGPSPEWLSRRLQAIGVRPINNVVDITNYVLHELGHPLHAFDMAKIKGNKVIVRPAKANETFVSLDEESREMTPNDLMICNEADPMCIAGVFGGLDSGVSDSTTDVFLESAYFNPVWVRKTAKRQGLNTDASFRFERGADPNKTIDALKRAATLILEIAGGKISSEISDIYPNPIENFEIDFRYSFADRLIGTKIPHDTIKSILTGLEIDILEENGDLLKLSVPPFKVDVTREIDVVEEILRIYGYNQVEMPEKVMSSLSYGLKPNPEQVQNRIADMLVSNGFSEMMHNSLTQSKHYAKAEGWSTDRLVEMANPLSQDLDVMRQNLLFHGLETVARNINHRNNDLKFFEFGKAYFKSDNSANEERRLSLIITGKAKPESWRNTANAVELLDIRTMVDQILDSLGLSAMKFTWSELDHSDYKYGAALSINKRKAGHIGCVSGAILKQFDIDQEVFVAEISWETILSIVANARVKYTPIAKYPSVRRDLALLVDQATRFGELEEIALRTEKKFLKKVDLFDVYEGDNLPEGKKSYALSFILQDDEKTLVDKVVEKSMNKIAQQLERQLGATIRS